MNPKKKILILSGCLLTVAAVVGGTFFVQKSSNHVLNKTSIGKFHEGGISAEERRGSVGKAGSAG